MLKPTPLSLQLKAKYSKASESVSQSALILELHARGHSLPYLHLCSIAFSVTMLNYLSIPFITPIT